MCLRHTCIIIFVKYTPIVWYYKCQDIIKSFNFGSEVVALRKDTDIIKSLCYKLHIMGVILSRPGYFLGNKKDVVNGELINESRITNMLKISCRK